MSTFLAIPPDLFPPEQAELWRILNARLLELADSIGVTSTPAVASVALTSGAGYSGSHDVRQALPAPSVPEGTTFYEQDRGVWYIATTTTGQRRAWRVVGGEYAATLANKPGDLGADDAGFRFRATNYERVWIWDGSAWKRAPGELPTLALADAAAAVSGTGWHSLDGSSGVTYTKDDATTGTVNLPSGAGLYLKQGVWDGLANTATNGTITGSTGAAGSHTHTGTAAVVNNVGFGSGAGTPVSVAGAQSATVSLSTQTDHTHAAGTLAVSGADPGNVLVYRAVRL